MHTSGASTDRRFWASVGTGAYAGLQRGQCAGSSVLSISKRREVSNSGIFTEFWAYSEFWGKGEFWAC